MNETWDKELELNAGLVEGKHAHIIMGIQPYKSQSGKQGIKLIFPENYVLRTTAQNMIEALRNNKPVLGKTLSYTQKGTELARRFSEISLK